MKAGSVNSVAPQLTVARQAISKVLQIAFYNRPVILSEPARPSVAFQIPYVAVEPDVKTA